MKKTILIEAFDGTSWVGGLYYKRNIVYSLLQNEKIMNRYNFLVLTYPENVSIFEDFGDRITVKTIHEAGHRRMELQALLVLLLHRCKYVFPSENTHFRWFGVRLITWFPDFQHNHLSENFSAEECSAKTARVNRVIENRIPLVLSSEDCLRDFREYYSKEYPMVSVVPFVSYLAPILRKITKGQEEGALEKFDLLGKRYACVMNQFWQHKNHIVVFSALKRYFEEHPDSDFCFVFTGKMEDYRNPEYIQKLRAYTEDPAIKNHIKILGFLERQEQIILMKRAEYVIQPSLFEGWGTVVEDAKVLDKTILLSDIPVHREQKNEKCILFDAQDVAALSELIAQENTKTHVDDMELGIRDMQKRAKEYSEGFLKFLE